MDPEGDSSCSRRLFHKSFPFLPLSFLCSIRLVDYLEGFHFGIMIEIGIGRYDRHLVESRHQGSKPSCDFNGFLEIFYVYGSE